MGGWTKIQLKDTSQENIDQQNERLREYGLRKDIRFYSEKDIIKEWEHYQNDGPEERAKYYPPHMFPQDIQTLEEFKKYWNPEAIGVVFCPKIGALHFDCYFGQTSKTAMHKIAYWILCHGESQGIRTEGSYSTFVERSGYKAKTNQKYLMKFN